MAEEWRWVPGYEGRYEVSDQGRVRSFARYKNGRLLTATPVSGGYSKVGLSEFGNTITYSVHSLVAEAFIGPRPEGLQVNHIDGVKTNNNVNNLEYVTPSENLKHAFKIGLSKALLGENSPRSKLKRWEVKKIRILYSKGATAVELGKQFQVARATISAIVAGKEWKHVKGPIHKTGSRHGVHVRGEGAPKAKLTKAKVIEIRKRFPTRESTRSLAEEFGVSESTIKYVASGKSWKHVKEGLPLLT